MIGTVFRLFCTRLLPVLVLLIALLLGWLNTLPIPEATIASMIFPIFKGYVPPVFSGGFKECPVPALPTDDVTIKPRPEKETFVLLPGYAVKSEDSENEDENDINAKLDEMNAPFKMPQQGIGMCCRYTAYDPESVRRTILWYLKQGGRHIDTADMYFNHQWIGEAIQIAMRDYKIPRTEIWVTTKLYPRSYGTNSTLEAIHRMMKELQLDYLDLVLMHAPSNKLNFIGPKSDCDKEGTSPKECRLETWKALSQVRDQGLVRHVGVSNFNVRQLQEIQALGDSVAPIANNQFQFNPWVPDYAHETFDYCQEQGISVTAWSSFAGTMMQHMQAFTVDTLQKIAKQHSTTVPQILLRWAIQKGAIVIPGTSNPKHMVENLQAYNLELSPQEMADIAALRNDESARQFLLQPADNS